MNKIQCTGCNQVFWTEFQLESLISSGEWIEKPCPKCGTKWAVFQPEAASRTTRGGKARPGQKRRGRPSKALQAKGERSPVKKKARGDGFSPAAIRRLRKKLGFSQIKFASLVGVSIGTIVGWESGRFKPRANKVAELSNLGKLDKEHARTRLTKQQPKRVGINGPKTRVKRAPKPKASKQGKPAGGKISEAPSNENLPEPENAKAPKSQETPQPQGVERQKTARRRAERGGRRKATQGRKQPAAS